MYLLGIQCENIHVTHDEIILFPLMWAGPFTSCVRLWVVQRVGVSMPG